ncbi:MAG TPA: hypothetical protein VMT15_06235 [Bryobacteraceae bacterium]|nr:hypothetical protein [Bryobacteraceae bacterium]HVO97645.1 hypothetical protein [Bryobacteraceae bacterium]
MLEQIEEVGSGLEREALAEMKLAAAGEIDLGGVESAKRVAAQIPLDSPDGRR